MTSLLSTHLSQIALCATSIADLPFPGPKIFTNALLSPAHDITSLIRDTEQHERALFHLAPPPLPPNKSGTNPSLPGGVPHGGPFGDFGASAASTTTTAAAAAAAKRRATQYAGPTSRQPKNKAVAAVLGGDLYQRTRRVDEAGGSTRAQQQQQKAGEIDVEVLLLGAEKLAAVYPIPGAQEKITALRRRHQQLEANLAHYEARVAEQIRELQAMSRPRGHNTGGDRYDEGEELPGAEKERIPLTIEDLRKEEEEVRELERKKKGLEERVEGMERDLGGLMR